MKLKIVTVLLILSMMAAGCGKKIDKNQKDNEQLKTESQKNTEHTEMDSGNGIQQDAENTQTDSKTGTQFPDSYQHKSESGKVEFNCRIEVPDFFIKEDAHKLTVSDQCYGDKENILAKYVESGEIAEEHPEAAHDGLPDSVFYIMTDGSSVHVGDGFSYSSANAKYYTYVGAADSENQDAFRSGEVSFATADEAVEAVQQEMAEIGFSEFDFQFEAYPLNYKDLKKMEDQYIKDGMLKEEKRKTSWTKEDNAYVVYAFQLKDRLPILHEWMGIFRVMAYDNVDNAPVTAIYSSRGLERLHASPVYYFKDTEETPEFMEFDEAAAIVEEKFENILNDAHYVIDRAKLFQMVHKDEKQEYAVEPVWYFEVVEDGTSRSVTLINAVNGKETLLQ